MPSLEMSPVATSRIALVDILRGGAILAMIAYHLSWDLSYLGFWPIDVSSEPGWIAFQRSILFSFLFLVGAGLVLGHGKAIRWWRFWFRLGLIAAAALAMSVGTYLLFGDAFAFFGILHAIVLFSLLGLLFLRAPIWLAGLAALAFIVPALLIHSDAFDTRWLAWIGFWTEPPRTADLVSVFPWFGVTLLGIAATRWLGNAGALQRLAKWRPTHFIFRGLGLAGRWSLLVYLLHQPLLLGVLLPLANWLQPGVASPVASFVEQCEPSCLETGGVAGYCKAYCGCALETIEHDNLFAAVDAEAPTPAQSHQIDAVINLCRAMAE